MSTHSALVTGAGGFIGGHLTRHLIDQGWSVTAMVRQPDHAAAMRSLGAEPILCDLDVSETMPVSSNTDVVFHLAATMTTWSEGVHAGIRTTQNLVDAMKRWDCGRLVLLSSSAVHAPVHAAKVVDESSPTSPHPTWDFYALQKLAVEELVLQHVGDDQLSASIIRPPRVLGAGDRRLVPFIQKLAKSLAGSLACDGASRMPVVVVADLVQALAAVGRDPKLARTYYVSSATEFTKRDLINAFVGAGMPRRETGLARTLVAGAFGAAGSIRGGSGLRAPLVRALERRAGRPVEHDCVLSSRRAAEDFGWRGGGDVSQAIAQAVEWDAERFGVPASRSLKSAAPLSAAGR